MAWHIDGDGILLNTEVNTLGKTSGRLIISQYGLLCVSTKQSVVKMFTDLEQVHSFSTLRIFSLQGKGYIEIKGIGQKFKKIEVTQVKLNVHSVGNICECPLASSSYTI